MSGTSGKICVICGQDCSSKPRIKDARGQYACRVCVEAKKAGRADPRREPGDAGAGPIPVVGGLDDLLPVQEQPADDGLDDLLVGLAQPAELAGAGAGGAAGAAAGLQSMNTCPKCGRPVMPDQVVCLDCGTNLQSGRKLKTKVRDRDAGEAPPPPSTARLGLAIAASVVGAAIGLGIWLAVGSASGYSSHVMVFVVGAMAAAPALAFVRGAGTVTTGVIAATAAFLAIAAGMRMTPADRIEGFEWTIKWTSFGGTEQEETFDVVGLDESQVLIFDGAWIALGVLTAFSIGATNPYDEEDDDEDE